MPIGTKLGLPVMTTDRQWNKATLGIEVFTIR
jgi:hypothetical protein